jgi:hypothetical protein
MTPILTVPHSINPSARKARQANFPLSPIGSVPDATISLDEIIGSIKQLHREFRALQTAAGDMKRRIKSAERWVAVGRRASLGLEPVEGKFPDVTTDDEDEVRERFPSFYFILAQIEERQKDAKAKLDHLSSHLPVAAWVTSFRGVGIGSLGAIVASCGDLSNYPSPAKLWKRLGLDVTSDGKAPKRVSGVKTEYNPKRRAEVRMIGSAILRAGGDGGWVEVYRQRKAYEVSKAQAAGLTILPAARLSARKNKSDCISEGHIHNRALRYMEKRLIRDLWREWTGRGQEWSEPDRLAAD